MGQSITTRFPAYSNNNEIDLLNEWQTTQEWNVNADATVFFNELFGDVYFYRALTISIAGELVNYITDSITYQDIVEGRSDLSVELWTTDQNKEYHKGQAFELTFDDTVLFRGVVERARSRKESRNSDGTWAKIWAVDVVCQTYYTDKRLIAMARKQELAGDIVKDIITETLSEEGITIGQIEDGIIIEEALFNFVPATQALDSLAEKCGFTWFIDIDKQLYFRPYEASPAPWNVTPTTLLDADNNATLVGHTVEVIEEAPRYRNQHIVKGGRAVTSLRTEFHKGDGEQTTFTTGYDISQVPTVYVNDIEETVGIRGVDSDRQWYWNKGKNTITQDNNEEALESTDTLKIEYIGEFPIVTRSQDPEKIYERKLVEGGSGIVEEFSQDGSIESINAGLQLGNSKIAKYGTISKMVVYHTERPGLTAGMLQKITLPEYGLDQVDFLIESIEFEERDRHPYYIVQAVFGPTKGSWTKFFLEQRREAQAIIREGIGEGETLILPYDFTKNWVEGNDPYDPDFPNIFSELYPATDLYPSEDLFPVFNLQDRVKYCAILDNNGDEVFRKSATIIEGIETDEITTTVYIGPRDALGLEMGSVSLVGGTKATSEIGTGILIHNNMGWSLTGTEKTEYEALQITIKDVKWYA